TTVRSYRAHRAKGAGMPYIVRLWAAPAILGVALGSALAAFAPAALFKLAFAVIASLIATKLLFGRDSWRIANELPGRLGMAGFGFLVGLCSALMGVSGGSVSNIILTLHGKSLHQAVATSAGLGVPITIAGTIGYMLAGLPHQAGLPPFSIGFGAARRRGDGAGLDLHGGLWRAACPCALETPARGRVRDIPAARLGAVRGKPPLMTGCARPRRRLHGISTKNSTRIVAASRPENAFRTHADEMCRTRVAD